MASNFLAVLLSWSFDPPITLALVLAVILYGVGWRRLRQRSHTRSVIPTWRVWMYALGILALVLALLSPIDTFDGLLFWVHMTQHLLLIQVAAPLVLLGSPALAILWGLPEQERRGVARLLLAPTAFLPRVGHLLTEPLVALGLFLATVGVWHLPRLYDVAQGPTPIHTLEHLMFFGTSLLFWWPIIHPSGGRRRLSLGLAIPYLVPPMIEAQIIGALLTFADSPIYTTYQVAPRAFGLSVMQDQQLGGLIMWIPGGMLYTAIIFLVLHLALSAEERSVRAAELRAARLACRPTVTAIQH